MATTRLLACNTCGVRRPGNQSVCACGAREAAEVLVRSFDAVELVAFGAPVTGVWCPHCCLPSAVTVCYVGVAGLDVVVPPITSTVCHDCGAEL